MSQIAATRPDSTEYSTNVAGYIRLVPEGDILEILEQQRGELARLVGGLSDEEALVHHAPYTWSIKQVVGHMTDCERIFGYRALRLARHDGTPLPSFDENAYMAPADFDRCEIGTLSAEFDLLRRSHLLLFRNLTPAAWLYRGVVRDQPMTTRAVAAVMAGHAQHHLNILHKRLGA